ncbi:hypothetical protein [Epilithonimonas caeni]|uniref:hypothetical protein n=1 Tax=Epilithonimonas caeni TaxID=365343 RepID=UPI00040E92D6|nr:hypothetical protein [Epilithonimonas caeni]
MKFYIKSLYPEDEKKNRLERENGIIEDPIELSWFDDFQKYCLEWSEQERPSKIFLSDKFILVLFYKDSNTCPYPNNLVRYNLKKEVIGIIQTPKPLQYKGNNLLLISSIGKVKIIDNVEHLSVVISTGDYDMGFSEFRYLNLETFEYHPTYYEIQELFGQYSKTPTRWEYFGR